MRIIEIENLEEGMILGKTIFSTRGEILLRKGVILKRPLIDAISRADLIGIYIDDEFSKGIEPTEIIDENFRNNAVKKIKSFFTMSPDKMDYKRTNAFNRDINKILQDIIDQILNNNDAVINLVSLKNHDDYTFQHSINVAIITAVLGVGMDYNRDRLAELVKGAVFHDLGKMFINQEILNKPGKLTAEEFLIIKQHPALGFDFARTMLNLPINSLIGIVQHHEKFNGGGYPASKTGALIHKNSQLIAIADVFDAITSKRTYHEARLPNEAIEYIMGNADTHFSKEIVSLFLNKVAVYPVGCIVELSNGMKGIVFENTEGCTLRPIVKIFTDNINEMYVDLALPDFSSIVVTKVIM